jgi:ubiquitin C-terminal hydrolase
MDLTPYNSIYTIKPNGFPNFGNSCFFNSLLQCLLSCTSIFEVLIHNRNKDHIKNNVLAQNLIELYEANIAGDPLDDKCRAVWRSVINISKSRKDSIKIVPGMQHDAQEGLMLFLDVIDTIPELKRLFMHRHRIEVTCNECKKKVVDKAEDNMVFEVQPDLKMPQLEKFKNLDKYYNLSMPLNRFLRKQNGFIEGFRCTECKSTLPKFKTTTLTMIPEILAVTVKKYYEKVLTPFPGKLEFISKGRKKKFKYTLVAQSEHSGSMFGGHYWAIGLRKNDNKLEWKSLNDSNVSDGVPGPTPNTYLLFYHFTDIVDVTDNDLEEMTDS